MNSIQRLLFMFALIFSLVSSAQTPSTIKITQKGKGHVNTRIDNMGYWKQMVLKGFVLPETWTATVPAVKGSDIISGDEIRTQDSPDVLTTENGATTQSENSVTVNPMDEFEVMNSNNSTVWTGIIAQTLMGADELYSTDGGSIWQGSIINAGELNFGDPAAAIDNNGRYFIGKINTSYGQSVAWADSPMGIWHEVTIAGVPSPGNDILDKNHLCVDNSESSPYEGNLYAGWTAFVGVQNGNIQVSRSTDHGLTWSLPVEISQGANAAGHDQGVNLQTGPGGEVYAVWAVYDDFPGDECALGFARSLNGGSVFMPAFRIIDNIRGLRNTGVDKGIRTNSFPSMAVDISGGSYDGAIYVVWANTGIPGINTGTGVDVYMIRSFDQGSTWSAPIKVNQDQQGLGKKHFFPWITCDPDNGNLAVIYYDDRNTSSTQCETYISYSYDAGDSWTDVKVSDVAFTPAPIPGLATGYFGDYLGITSKNRKVYPVWTDNRSGVALTYISPVDLGPAPGQAFVVYENNALKRISDLQPVQDISNGDSLFLTLGLRNLGDQPAQNVTTYLSSDSPYVTITDSIEEYGDFSPGELKSVPDGFSFDVSDSIPDETRVRFNIRCESSDTLWKSHFVLKAKAPSIKITKLIIYDTISGNHNSRLDPGESAVLTFRIMNTGDYPCTNSRVHLSTSSGDVVLATDSAFIGTINPKNTAQVSFTISVNEETLFGSWADFNLDAYCLNYRDHGTFIETIGTVVEDWETGNFLKFPWTFGGDTGWGLNMIDPFEGLYSSKSKHIFAEQSAILQINYTSGVNDSISFWLKTSSEPSYDYLNFYIDNVKQGQWSGETPWKRASFPTASGTHNYKWAYSKDIFYDSGEDCAWIDYIDFPPPVLPSIYAGPDDTVCQGQEYQTLGTAADYDSLKWSTTGDGTFTNDTIVNPVYYPGNSDITSGSAKLKLIAWRQGGSTGNFMDLTIGKTPTGPVIIYLPDDTVCAGLQIHLSVDTITGYSYRWMPGGYNTTEITVDTALTGGIGTFPYSTIITSDLGCVGSDTILITFKDCTGTDEKEPVNEVIISPNPFKSSVSITLNREAAASSSGIILTDAKGIIVKHFADVNISGGITNFVWDGLNDHGEKVAAGVYHLILQNSKKNSTYKIVFLP